MWHKVSSYLNSNDTVGTYYVVVDLEHHISSMKHENLKGPVCPFHKDWDTVVEPTILVVDLILSLILMLSEGIVILTIRI